MPLRAIILLLALVGGVAAQERGRHASPRRILSACAAFAPDGASAAVSVDADSFVLEIAEPSGEIRHLNRPLRHPVTPAKPVVTAYPTCKDYFDRNSGLVAVGIESPRAAPGQLQVAVADLKTLTWIGDWGVGRESGMYPSLAGFLDGTISLAVTGQMIAKTAYGDGVQWGSFATLLFDPTGKQLTVTPVTRTYAHDTDIFPTYADPRNNRLWFLPCAAVSAPLSGQPLCPIDSVTLTGTQQAFAEFAPSVQGKKRTDLWFPPESFTVPDSSTVMIAGKTMLWRVNLQAQTVDQLVLPIHVHFPNLEGAGGPSAISPDGQVVAVPLRVESFAFPYLLDNYAYKGTDIAVVQVRPLQMLGILKHERASDPVAFAIRSPSRHRPPSWCDARLSWDRREFDAAPKTLNSLQAMRTLHLEGTPRFCAC